MTAELFVICYPTPDAANQVLQVSRRLEAAHLLRLEDCVTVSRADDGKPAIHHCSDRSSEHPALGAFWGAVLGKWFGAALLGAGFGAADTAIAHRLPDEAIDQRFVRDVIRLLGPNSSALFALVRRHSAARVLSAPDKVVPEVGRFGGTVLHTTLSNEVDKRLQAALDEAHHRAEALRSATLMPRHANRKRVVNPTRASARTAVRSVIPTPRASAGDERPF
jgi:uncharacterized membrane protein